MSRTRIIFYLVITLALLLAVCGPPSYKFLFKPTTTAEPTPSPDRIDITIIYAPEYKDLGTKGKQGYLELLPKVMADFNSAYEQGKNPLTGEPLRPGEKRIRVTGKDVSSGTAMDQIVNAVLYPQSTEILTPTIYSPSVSHWLVLANFKTNRELFTVSEARPTGLAPVVIAIWKSLYEAIQANHPGQSIGWEELLEVMNEGWGSVGVSGLTTVKYGHTNPYISSTGISILMSEFNASARYIAGVNERRLTLAIVNNPKVQEGVRQWEAWVKHYSRRTTEFKHYLAQGIDYLHFMGLEENDVLAINRKLTQYVPSELLMALYPKEGTFWHEHPFAIPNADWVTPEQREAAKVFTDYVRSEAVQKLLMEAGFRPANINVRIGYPFVPELGVDPLEPSTILELPSPEVLAAIQNSWMYVKKQADVFLLADTTGSMSGDKLNKAKEAMKAFVSSQENENRVGLIRFSTDWQILVEIDSLEVNKEPLAIAIDGLRAGGNTAMYKALLVTMDQLRASSPERIKAVVLLSDGLDNQSWELFKVSLNDVVQAINQSREREAPILVFPIAYGNDADWSKLGAIAQASQTLVQEGSLKEKDLKTLFEIIASYF